MSHDRRLLDTICERLWVVDGGLVVAFEGGYRAWREAVAGGWTVAAAVELEGRRLHPEGGPTRAWRPVDPDGRSAMEPAGEPRATGRATVPDARDGSPARARVSTATRLPKLSKDAYRRQREAVDIELTRLGLRKSHLELSMGDAAVQANFVELRRITSELADIETALTSAEDAWLVVEERAP